jgi:hypothetical protein
MRSSRSSVFAEKNPRTPDFSPTNRGSRRRRRTVRLRQFFAQKSDGGYVLIQKVFRAVNIRPPCRSPCENRLRVTFRKRCKTLSVLQYQCPSDTFRNSFIGDVHVTHGPPNSARCLRSPSRTRRHVQPRCRGSHVFKTPFSFASGGLPRPFCAS